MASTSETSRVDRSRPILEQPDSPLLRLPGEIRNRIYEQVLTHRSSLWFVPGSYHRIRENGKPEKAYFAIEPDKTYNIKNDFNQLKYVCRQMYDETHCQELKFNLIWFIGESVEKGRRWRPARAFVEFLKECVPSKQRYISQVGLQMRSEGFHSNFYYLHTHDSPATGIPLLFLESAADFETIANFCRKHPTSRVDYTAYDWNTDPCESVFDLFEYLKQGILMILALRHKDLLHLLPNSRRPGILADRAERWASFRCVQQLKVENLRFSLPKELNFADFKEHIEEDAPTWDMTNTQIKGCIELYKEMEKNGI